MLLSEACSAYMEAKSKKLRQTTLDGYVSGLRRHVLPTWGVREMASIRRWEVQEWVDGFSRPGAAEKALKCLRQVMRWAIRHYDLELFDPTQGVELPAKPVYRRESMDAREEASVLKAAVGQPWEAVVICAAALGLRPSEAAGLDWSDVDWRSGWVHVQRGAHSTQGGTVEYGCKTRLGDRYLKLPRFALERLRKLRGQRRRGRMRGDLSPRQIYSRFKRFLRRLGLGRCSMECLRHTWATLTIEGGAALADVSVALGHASVSTCLQHYLMSTRSVVQRAQDCFSNVMRRSMDEVPCGPN